MSVRRHFYLVCTQCNNQYMGEERSAEKAREIRAIAKADGWKYAKVLNGSMWDFCPRCLERNRDYYP